MARPTKLTPELLERAKAYKSEDTLPTLEDFALYLDVSRSTIYEWKKIDDEFSDIVEKILEMQGRMLINKGLSGEFNPTITKLILSGKHGYVEKSEVDQHLRGDVTFINDVPRPHEADKST